MEDKFITLQWSFIREKNTTMQEKLILMEISNLSMLKHGCVAMNEHFAELLGVKKESVSRSINSLEKKGYISSKIKQGTRNFSRTITINKMLFDPKQNVIQPLTNCLETKENNTSNNTNEKKVSEFDSFIAQLKEASIYKTKVTKTKEGERLFKTIEDKKKLFTDYLKHQEEKKEFSVRITAFMEDYKTVHSKSNQNKELTDEQFWGGQQC